MQKQMNRKVYKPLISVFDMVKCKYCKTKFEPSSKIQKYCSPECGHRANYENQKEKIMQRNKEFKKKFPERVKESNHKYYSSERGQEKKKIRDFSTRHLKSVIYEKFESKCSKCGSLENLEIHHAKYTKDINDLILLCKTCHGKEHRHALDYMNDEKN